MNHTKSNLISTLLLLTSFLVLISATASFGQTILFSDDFGSGNADRWQLPPPGTGPGEGIWQVVDDGGNVLSGSQHSTASTGILSWSNYSLKSRIKLMAADSGVHINVRTQGGDRYYIGFKTTEMYLHSTKASTDTTLVDSVPVTYVSNQWYSVEVVVNGGSIKVYVDSVLKIDVTDASPVLSGAIAFEVLNDSGSPVHFDDVVVSTDEPLSAVAWTSTGGPLGGLGYDVRIHPTNTNIMYVTDNYAGVAKSDNGGQSWSQSNSGITVRGGSSGDAVNIFSLTVDQNNPATIWAGTNGEGSTFGVYKSTDSGATWTSKTRGMALSGAVGIVFRGFTIQQGNSNIIYAQAEIPTLIHGKEFDRVKGRVYKTTDGGENWSLIWEGDSLARYLIIDPTNPAVLYLSTGIFDREAFNYDCKNGPSGGGLGVLKSINGGQTWTPVNTGLDDLYVGSLRMHPTNPQILFAAAGNNACSGGSISGLFMTTDGGAIWTKVIADDIMTTVNFSPSDPLTIYAGSAAAFYRSQDGGTVWSRWPPSGPEWGPAGVRAGVPIDVTVDPVNPLVLYANNYGGGVFRSLDGAVTWEVWSKGYSGADIHQVHIPATSPATVLAIGRSGPFKSANYGADWIGLANGEATYAEWDAIIAKPSDSAVLIITDEHQGVILRSSDGGNNFSKVFTHPDALAGDPTKRQGFRGLAFAASSTNIVYAGLSKDRSSFLTTAPIGTVIYKSLDSGQTFSPKPSILDGAYTNVRRLVVDPNNPDMIYAATTNGVYRSSDGAVNWTLLGLGGRQIEALAVNPLQPGYLIAGEIFGGIWISSNGGAAWAGPHNSGFNSSNPYISSLVMDPDNPNTIFAGDLYSGVYRSLDQGDTWAPYPDWKMSGLTIRAVKDLAISAKAMYAATQGGGVFRFDRTFGLSASKSGAGAGSVTSSPAGINCGATCSQEFTAGIDVDLTAAPATGAIFSGWTGDCTGTSNPCRVTMTGSRSVSATFTTDADFNASPASGTAPVMISFQDLSQNVPTSWSWIFGDGGTSTLQNPAHLYTQSGLYTVQLTANGTGSAVVSKTAYISVSGCANGKIRLAGVYPATILNAYTDATDGATMEIQALDFTEGMVFNQNKIITLKGGFDCDYSNSVGYTTINGLQSIRSGKVVMERIKIK